jgi:hypothetical protein
MQSAQQRQQQQQQHDQQAAEYRSAQCFAWQSVLYVST